MLRWLVYNLNRDGRRWDKKINIHPSIPTLINPSLSRWLLIEVLCAIKILKSEKC